jgi:predicted transcriptional regulator
LQRAGSGHIVQPSFYGTDNTLLLESLDALRGDVGCKVCERPNCPRRAFPPIGWPLDINEGRSRFTPYSAT